MLSLRKFSVKTLLSHKFVVQDLPKDPFVAAFPMDVKALLKRMMI
jgi:hypothetical protein